MSKKTPRANNPCLQELCTKPILNNQETYRGEMSALASRGSSSVGWLEVFVFTDLTEFGGASNSPALVGFTVTDSTLLALSHGNAFPAPSALLSSHPRSAAMADDDASATVLTATSFRSIFCSCTWASNTSSSSLCNLRDKKAMDRAAEASFPVQRCRRPISNVTARKHQGCCNASRTLRSQEAYLEARR